MRAKLTVPILLFAVALAGPAGAVTLNFAALAEASGDETALSFAFTNVGGSGVDVVAVARRLSDGTPPYGSSAPYVFMDEYYQGRPGGLGVCKTSDCEGSGDDDIARGEVAILTFSAPVAITEILFSNGRHRDHYTGNIGVHIGDTDPTHAVDFSHVFGAAAEIHPLGWSGNRFSFVSNASFPHASRGGKSRLYIESISFELPLRRVPEPSPLVLLGLGAAALAARRRTR